MMVEAAVRSVFRRRYSILFALIGAPIVTLFIGMWTQSGSPEKIVSEVPLKMTVAAGSRFAVRIVSDKARADLTPTYRYLGWYTTETLTAGEMERLRTRTDKRVTLNQIPIDDRPLFAKIGLDVNVLWVMVPRDTAPGDYWYWVEKPGRCWISVLRCAPATSKPVLLHITPAVDG